MNILKKRTERTLRGCFGKYYEEFVKMMIRSGAILTGTFILQCVLEEVWNECCLEIYVPDSHFKCVCDDFKSEPEQYFGYDYFSNHMHPIQKQVKFAYPHNAAFKPQIIFHKKSVPDIHAFDVYNSQLTFGENLALRFSIPDVFGLLQKRSTFSINSLRAFYIDVPHFNRLGFFCKPKYNRLLCLEYILLRHSNEKRIIRYNKNGLGPTCSTIKCDSQCPIRLFYHDFVHHHTIWHGKHYIIVGIHRNQKTMALKDSLFHILPTFMSSKKHALANLTKTIGVFHNLDDYAKIRNSLAECKTPIDTLNTSQVGVLVKVI
jgi:hypothetical protein